MRGSKELSDLETRLARRRLLLAAALCCPAAALAEAPARVAHVVIAYGEPSEKRRESHRALFAEHGWVAGRNLALSYVNVVGAPNKAEAEARAREVVASRPDAILMIASAPMAIFKRLTRDIPVVFFDLAIDPAKLGLVESLRRPGGNFTGTSHFWEETLGKMWAVLKEVRPAMKRGAELGEKWDPQDDFYEAFPAAGSIDQETKRAIAKRLGIEIVEIDVSKGATLAVVVQAIRKARPDALLTDIYPPGLFAFLEEARIPAIGRVPFARSGGLLGMGIDPEEGFRQAVAIVARILRGESPATIPVYQGTRYHFAVNLRTARAMGLAIPVSVLVQATEVIE